MKSYPKHRFLFVKLLCFAMLIWACQKCHAQNPPQKVNADYQFRGVGSDSVNRLPLIAPSSFYKGRGRVYYNSSDSTVHALSDTDNILNSNPIPIMSFSFNTADGDSKTAFPGFYTSDTTKMWFKLACSMMNLKGVNRSVSGRALVTDSVAIFSGLTDYNGGVEFIALGINDLIQSVNQARFINCFDTLLVRLHRDHHFPYSKIGILGIDAYGGVVAPQASIPVWNKSLDSLNSVFGTFFYNIYAYCSINGGGNFTIDSLHGRDDWNYLAAISMAHLSGFPIQSSGQRLAVNGKVSLSSLNIGVVDSAGQNDMVAAISPTGDIHRFKHNNILYDNPLLPQVGGFKTTGPDTSGNLNVRGTTGLKLYQINHVLEGARIVYNGNGITNALVMFAFDDAGNFKPINLETDNNSYVTIGQVVNPINNSNLDLFVNRNTTSGGFSSKGASLWAGGNAFHLYLQGLHGQMEANDFSTATPHDISMQVIGRNVLIGDTVGCATCKLEVTSTTQGIRLPVMTTVQKLAISSPAEGLEVYDLTLHQKSYWNGSAWINL